MSSSSDALYLKDVLNLPKSVLAGDFKVELSGGFGESGQRVREYVITDQLEQAFRKSLGIVKAAVRDNTSHAAYLHGSFGSGKSHFLTVLHAILNDSAAVARDKPKLQAVIAEHADWLVQEGTRKRFLMVPYHLVGAASLDSALLGGYVATVRRLHPGAPVPPVYRADAALADARRQRDFLADDAKFIQWLGDPAGPDAATQGDVSDGDDLDDLDAKAAPASGWTSASLDAAFAAAPGDELRNALISALISDSGPMASYARGAQGDKNAFLPLENGLAVISRHAQSLGYDGLVLFLDELILWLQAHLTEKAMVNDEVSKLVKLIESGDTDRPVPIVSFISRQRDLSQLVGSDVVGADVKNLEQQVGYLAGRFDVVSLEDRNLPAIIKERVLKPKDDAARAALGSAFATVESSDAAVREVLLDAAGATRADWADFKELYPLSPVLLNTLVALSGALQRERTGLKLIQEMLYRRREDMKLGDLIPLGDLWDVLADGMGEAFTDRLRAQSEAAIRFHTKVQAFLLQKYGSTEDAGYRADDRFVKTLLLGFLSPEVPALSRLTGGRLAALNHGSLRSRAVTPGELAVRRLRELQAEFPGELRSDGNDADPVFTLHLSDLDVEPILDAVGEKDNVGQRRIWVKERLWEALGVRDTGAFVCEHEVVWRGTKRIAEFVFENVKEPATMPTTQFSPSVEGRVRFVVDYPFDESDGHPSDDTARIQRLRQEGVEAATVVWLPFFFSPQRSAQLGRLLKIQYLLERDRLANYAAHLPSDDQIRVKHQLEAQRDTLTSQLTDVLRQLYGIASVDETNVGAETPDGLHVYSLYPGHTPQLQGGAPFAYNLAKLADGLFAALYPKHPDFDPQETRKPVTAGELKTVYGWIARAMEDGSRRVVVDSKQLGLVKRIVHPLELGEVHDGPLNVGTEWRRRIEQHATAQGVTGDYDVEDIRRWIAALGWTGLDKAVSNLLIAVYALVADRSWVFNGSAAAAPELDRIGPGWALRAQELPSEQEFTAAHERAAALFGESVPRVRYARNVNDLAAKVRAKAQGWEPAVNGLRRSLANHRAALGLTDEHNAREISVRDAADLIARLVRHKDATALVRELSALAYTTSDDALAKAMSSAQPTLDALDRVKWQLLDSVRGLTSRGDGLADRAERLLSEIAEAAAAMERDRELAPVLNGAESRAVDIISESGRLNAVAAPAPESTTTAGSVPDPRGADQVSLTVHGRPPLPAQVQPTPDTPAGPTASSSPAVPPARRRRLIVATSTGSLEPELEQVLAELAQQILSHAAAKPGTAIEIGWQEVEGGES
ncbi:PglY protein [Streptomyces himalayensis]|uniref:PglY protein n=1 Tax=Streptomyces himalayensis subsp. himalayensis TaxID=2756131 RepID=A0A7W0DRP7_9ACTN|nr:PglY protein [Streptomyces himalayensis]MBA2949605.1 PglY protein [Streptomyces himalayensis subsp. himalayensis]